jgi:opacity protein-like surface antigen
MRTPSTALVGLLAVALAPMPAAAQDAPQPASVRRPYRGLFAPPADTRGGRPSLDATFSLFGAYDDDIYAASVGSGAGTATPESRGLFTGGGAGLNFLNPGDTVSFGASAGVGVSYYPDQDRTTTAYRTAADVSYNVSDGTQLSGGASFSYAPEYRFGPFYSPDSLTGLADPFESLTPDLDIYGLASYRGSAQASFSHALGRRSSLSGWYSHSIAYREDDQYDYRAQGGGFGYSQKLTAHSSARLGYSFSTARYLDDSGLRPQRLHNLDIGVDYGRALSVSRRTTIGFSTGTALVANDDLSQPQSNTNFSFRVIGEAHINHEIGRTWTARAGYRRGVDFYEGFNEPFLSDSVNASLTGLLSRRLSFQSGLDYSFGKVGIGTSNGYDTLSAQAGLEYGLTSMLALYTNYIYYRYEFDQNVALDPRFAQSLNRQGVRFGLSASLPILR